MNKQALGRLMKGATAPIMESDVAYSAKIFDYGATVPTDTAVGYATGCIFLHTDGAAGTAFYVNEGTAASCTFAAVAGLTAAQEALLGAVAGTLTASTAIIVDENSAVDAINTAALSIGVSGSETLVTATAAELNGAADLSAQAALTSQGAAVPGTGGFVKQSVVKHGEIVETTLVIDLTGLISVATDHDVIGVSTDPAYIMQVIPATHGTIFAGEMGCMEVPTTGDDDIDLYASSAADGAYNDGAAGLADAAALTNNTAAHAIGTVYPLTALPTATADYLYLASTDTAGTYDAGIIYVKLWGYV